MSRYINFLCLLFINLVLCYDYSDVNPQYRPIHGMINTKLNNVNSYGHANEEDNDQEAEIDVASFIQSPDYDGLGSDNQFEEPKGDPPYNNNGFESLVEANLEDYEDRIQDYKNVVSDALEENANLDKLNQRQNKFNLQPTGKPDVLGSDKEPRKYYDIQHLRNIQKKCAFKNMKIPFFSHDQQNDQVDVPLDKTSKKIKKRKLFHFNSKKQKPATQAPTTSLSSNATKASKNTLFKLKKRSYVERMCPLCRKKFIARKSQPTDKHTNIIHNSRQFYQNKGCRIHNYVDNAESKRMIDTGPEQRIKNNNVLDKTYSGIEKDQVE